MYGQQYLINKELYPAAVLLKAAYMFLDQVYFHFDESEDGKNWIVNLSVKYKATDIEALFHEFESELIAQSVRLNIYQKTHTIREMIMARALSSTMVDEEDVMEKLQNIQIQDDDSSELESILTDWFEKNGR